MNIFLLTVVFNAGSHFTKTISFIAVNLLPSASTASFFKSCFWDLINFITQYSCRIKETINLNIHSIVITLEKRLFNNFNFNVSEYVHSNEV